MSYVLPGPQYLTLIDKNGIRLWITLSEASYKTLTPNILVPAVQKVLVHKGQKMSYLDYFFLYDSWWRWLASRWIFLGHYFYLPCELISSHGRKGRTNNHTNHQSSESWPFTISKLMCIQEILPDSHCLQMVGKCDHLPWKTDEKQELVKRPSLFSNKTFPKLRNYVSKLTVDLSLRRQFCTGSLCTWEFQNETRISSKI